MGESARGSDRICEGWRDGDAPSGAKEEEGEERGGDCTEIAGFGWAEGATGEGDGDGEFACVGMGLETGGTNLEGS